MKLDRCQLMMLLIFAPGPVADTAAETINKCTGDDGKVVYQKGPCDKRQIEEQKSIDPDRNAVKMELPLPSEEPKTSPKTTPASVVPTPRRGY
ncbi:MAG TPA: DUF4124 domain-containing protein [Burkholderiales bacterium]|nr:DUF4124 domain-containing protein [Burkholderiales bacterium]